MTYEGWICCGRSFTVFFIVIIKWELVCALTKQLKPLRGTKCRKFGDISGNSGKPIIKNDMKLWSYGASLQV
jgi:hypothetical protein